MSAGGESAVAAVRAVVPAATLNLLVLQSFTLLFIAGATRVLNQEGYDGLAAYHWQSTAWVMVLSFPIFALTFAVAPGVVPLVFGAAYADSAILLAILAVGQYATVVLAFNSETLQIVGDTRAVLWTNLLVVAIAVGLGVQTRPSTLSRGAAHRISCTSSGGGRRRASGTNGPIGRRSG